jgi:hypothetical protein
VISFFRISAIYKVFILGAVFAALYAPFFWYGMPLLGEEVHWMVIGERLVQGKALYTEVIDDISPLAAYVYWLLVLVAGKSVWVFRGVALALIILQAFLFNQLMRSRQIFLDRTLAPVLVYWVLMFASIDMFSLSPALLANTFLIVALNLAMLQISEKSHESAYFELGIWVGIAALFYLPSVFILFALWFAMFLFTGARLFSYIAVLLGMLFPLGLLLLVYYLTNQEYAFLQSYLGGYSFQLPQTYFSVDDWLILLAMPILLVIGAFLLINGNSKFTNYQERCHNIAFYWIVAGGVGVLFNNELSIADLIYLVPALAVVFSSFFLLIRYWIIREFLFATWIAASLFITFDGLHSLYPYLIPGRKTVVNPTALFVQPNSVGYFKQKKVMILGEMDWSIYQDSKPATPFIDWRLAQRRLHNLQDYGTLTYLYEVLNQERPEIILDKAKIVPTLFEHLPTIARQYQWSNEQQAYIRK